MAPTSTRMTARLLAGSLAGVLAFGVVAAGPALADPGHGNGKGQAKALAKAAERQAKAQAKAAEELAKAQAKAAERQAKAAREAARAAARAQVVVVPSVVASTPPPTIVIPPPTTRIVDQQRCAAELADRSLKRSQLEAQITALIAAQASARNAGRSYEADYLGVEIARMQRELAQVAFEIQKRQAECVGVPTVPVSTPAIVVPAVSVPVVTVTAPPSARPACAGAKGQLTALLRQIRNASRQAAHAQAASVRARVKGDTTKADRHLAEATRLQQRVTQLMNRRAALASACPAAL